MKKERKKNTQNENQHEKFEMCGPQGIFDANVVYHYLRLIGR